MSTIVTFIPDLMFGTRVEDAAKHLGLAVHALSSVEEAPALFDQMPNSLLVVSLDAPDWARVVASAKRYGVRVIAYGSHQDSAALQAARAAGCDQVVVRSRFAAELAALLEKYAG